MDVEGREHPTHGPGIAEKEKPRNDPEEGVRYKPKEHEATFQGDLVRDPPLGGVPL